MTTAITGSAGAPSAGPVVEECPPTSGATVSDENADGTSATACDLVGYLVTSDVGAVAVPSPGESVTMTELSLAGAESGMTVSVAPDGTIDVDVSDVETDPPAAGGGVAKCSDDRYKLLYKKWFGATEWYINRGTIPTADLDADNTVAALRSAIQNITNSTNACDMPDTVSAAAAYQGDTNYTAPITYDANGSICPSTWNGVSTVFFGDRQPGVGATTCTKAVARPGSFEEIVEADMEIDKSAIKWTTVPGSSGCNHEYDIESLITHEFGHWFGLGHALNSTNLVMYPAAPPPCTAKWRTLGKGDVIGLRQMY